MTCGICDFLPYSSRMEWTPDAIRAAREERGWTQAQLAEALSVSLRSVTSWERGEAHPRNISALERVLGEGKPAVIDPRLSEASNMQLMAELLRRLDRGNNEPLGFDGPVDVEVPDPHEGDVRDT